MEIVDARTGPHGKVPSLRRHTTRILLDDNAEICQELNEHGMIPIQVRTSGTKKHQVIYGGTRNVRPFHVTLEDFVTEFLHPTQMSNSKNDDNKENKATDNSDTAKV
jgi:hypothetical protein